MGTPTRRLRAVTATVVLAAAAVLAAGCSYAPPTVVVLDSGRTICAPRPPRTAAELQDVFDTRGPWWAGADGGTVIDLPDGRRLWLFGDTFVGHVNPLNRSMKVKQMVNNSLLVQSGRCFEVRLGGSPDTVTTSELVAPGADDAWWPTAGVFDPTSRTVRVIAMRQDGRHLFRNLGVDLLELSWPTLELVGHQPLPFTVDGVPAWGNSTLVDGGWWYVYGRNAGPYVARTAWPPARTPSWEYLARGRWVTDPRSATAMDTGGAVVDSPLDVRADAGRYVAVAKPADGIGVEIVQLSSTTPVGPWRLDGNLEPPARHLPDAWSYGAHTVRLDGGGLAVLQSENPTAWTMILDDTLRYGVKAAPYRLVGPPR